MNIIATLLADFYKLGHPAQYPKNTVKVYSNLTPRKSRLTGIDMMVFFGLQYFMKEYLLGYFRKNFFDIPKEEVMRQYKRRIRTSLGADLPDYSHIEKLHDLQYLPIEIKAIREGSRVSMKVPVLTITNTLPEHYWLPNFLETILSTTVWQPSTSATIAYEYRKILNKFAEETGMPKEFVQWQGHDFSFRGMSSFESAITSGMGHLLSFTGTDTIPAIDALEQYYNANGDLELIGGSVNATEHSVMCAGSKESELETFRRMICDVYPNGIVSLVSDTWDLWKVLTVILPTLKQEILARNGKVVIRPDSGDPVDILCGKKFVTSMQESQRTGISYFDGKALWTVEAVYDEVKDGYYGHTKSKLITDNINEIKGVVELLWDVFGGTLTSKGYKLLSDKVGAIYGDSITLGRATEICQRLKDKGFASQVVLGIGSYTYQYNTRDTFGTAMKATYVEFLNEEGVAVGQEIWKDPITDDGTKKSATGYLLVNKEVGGKLVLKDRVTAEEANGGELIPVFRDGVLLVDLTLAEIRATLAAA